MLYYICNVYNILIGMGAGTVEAIFAVTPMETIKTKLIQKNLNMVGYSMRY